MPAHAIQRNAFNEIAVEWDKNRRTPSPCLSLFLSLPAPNRFTALDEGCGNARNAVEIARHYCKVVACDSSPQMLEKARERVKHARALNVAVKHADAADLPFESNSFDAVFSLAVLHLIFPASKRFKAFKEISRVLKPGGLAFVSVWNKQQPRFAKTRGSTTVIASFAGKQAPRKYYFFSPAEFKKTAAKAGLQTIKVFF
ncbi:MAG: class I SAM-dependent methyltransferase, partial [Candidatus Norongarragalinales archaeon]